MIFRVLELNGCHVSQPDKPDQSENWHTDCFEFSRTPQMLRGPWSRFMSIWRLAPLAFLVLAPARVQGQQYYSHQSYSAPTQSYSVPTYSTPVNSATVSSPTYPAATYPATSYSQPRVIHQTRPAYPNQYGRTYRSQRRSSHPRSTRTQVNSIQSLKNARPGRYYNWQPAEGTSKRGYVAQDGSQWTLMKSNGIVEVDTTGRRRIVSTESSGHPYQYVWQINRKSSTARKTAWISRDHSTGAVSVHYVRPRFTTTKQFFPATVTTESGNKIVSLQWQRRPRWADNVSIASSTRPALPPSIYRATSRNYIPASTYDIAAARNASMVRKPTSVTPSRPYEESLANEASGYKQIFNIEKKPLRVSTMD